MLTLQRTLEYAFMVLSILFALMTFLSTMYYDWKQFTLIFPQFGNDKRWRGN